MTSLRYDRNRSVQFTQQKLILLIALVVLSSSSHTHAQETTKPSPALNSLSEVRDKRNALLMVFRSQVLDVGDNDRAIIDDVLKADPEPKGRNRWVYGQIASRLNKYIRKYRSLTPARELSDADYVIFFNVIEYRRILNTIYPYGELFVIVKGSQVPQKPPRVVWKARKILFAGDAIGDFIKELRAVRGET